MLHQYINIYMNFAYYNLIFQVFDELFLYHLLLFLILEKLGYKRRSIQENKRIRYILNDVEVDIDTWPGLNTYVEFEGNSESQIKDVFKLLDYKYEDAITDNAQDIYMSLGYTQEDLNNLKF